MTRFRRSLRTHSWIALVAFLCGGLLPFAEQHTLGEDEACVISPAGTGALTSTIADATADQNKPAHCLVCHLMRALNGAAQTDQALLPVPADCVTRHPFRADAALTVTDSATPPRGPPATI